MADKIYIENTDQFATEWKYKNGWASTYNNYQQLVEDIKKEVCNQLIVDSYLKFEEILTFGDYVEYFGSKLIKISINNDEIINRIKLKNTWSDGSALLEDKVKQYLNQVIFGYESDERYINAKNLMEQFSSDFKLTNDKAKADENQVNTISSSESSTSNNISTDDASDDLEEVEIPESSTVETVKGIQFNSDGSYVMSNSKTLTQLMQMFIQWWQLVQTIVRSSGNPGQTTLSTSSGSSVTLSTGLNNSSGDGSSDIVCDLNAQVMVNSAFDYMGHTMRSGLTCPICGTKVHSLKIGGYCSTSCALIAVAKFSSMFKLTPSEAYKEFHDTLDKILGLLDHTTLILNTLTAIPDILRELSTVPEPYRSYVQVKINEGFCLLYACVQKLMMKKQELIKKMMKPIKYGFIKKPLKVIFGAVEVILNATEYTQEAFDLAYMTLFQIISNLKSGMSGMTLSAESFGWMMTPHSFMSPKPYTSPDSGKLICELPGGMGLQSIAAIKPLMPSGMQNINFEAIDSMVKSLFPPLTPLDYYLEPEIFQVRYLFSDQSNVALQIRQQLEDLLTFGLDYIPKFENLSPVKSTSINGVKNNPVPNTAYAWFILALLDSWAPHSEALVGSLINPAV